MKIIVDADACPKSALRICLTLASQYSIPVWTVANFHHDIDSAHHIAVGNDPQETDIKIINMTEQTDVVVTQDWGLAAVVLGKGARSLSPVGREFHSDRIPFLLEERELKSKLRRRGKRTKGPRKRSIEDDQHFETCLERMILKTREGIKTDGL